MVFYKKIDTKQYPVSFIFHGINTVKSQHIQLNIESLPLPEIIRAPVLDDSRQSLCEGLLQPMPFTFVGVLFIYEGWNQMNTLPDLTSADVKKIVRDLGVDLVGIGAISRWKDIPETENPKEIMPYAKSVICLGFRIPRGTLRGQEEGTYYSAYTLTGFDDVNRIVAPLVLRRLTSFIEDHGYESCPIMYYSHNLGRNTGKAARRPDGSLKPRPEVFFNFRTAGVLCGVGEIGHSRMLLTPKFGPAQRLYFILTEAELEADPIISGVCDCCLECVRHCPAKALQYKANDNIDIPDVTMVKRSALDDIKCRLAHISGGLSPYAPEDIKAYVENIIAGTDTHRADGSPRPTLDELTEEVTAKVPYAANAQKIFGSPSALCGAGCIRACLAHLDNTGRLGLKFRHSFRK